MEYERLFDELLFFISLSISTMIGFEMVLNQSKFAVFSNCF